MAQVVQAKCPRCKRELRIPANWLQQALRCKHCGVIVRPRSRVGAEGKPASEAGRSAGNPVAGPVAKQSPEKEAVVEPATIVAASDVSETVKRRGLDQLDHLQNASPFAFDVVAGEEESDSGAGDGGAIVHVPRRFRRKRRPWLVPLIMLILIGAASVGGYFLWEPIKQLGVSIRAKLIDDSKTPGKQIEPESDAISDAIFPRRALVICVSNYLYANPVTYGAPGHNIGLLVEKLRRVLHIDASQMIELSDAAKVPEAKNPPRAGTARPAEKKLIAAGSPARPPLKSVIEKTTADFLKGCRAQDRIMVMFLGHVVELDNAVYLVPIEGDFKIKESLISLQWLYDRLKDCPARQKVLVIDSCRLDPGRGVERPGSGPMSEKIEAALAKPPEGIQVWTACAAKEFSYELEGNGVFVERLFESLNQRTIGKMQQAADPIPVEALAAAVAKTTSDEVAGQLREKQTSKVFGKEPENGSPFDKTEPLPPRLEIQPPAIATAPTARADDVRAILNEIELPPIKLARDEAAPQSIDRILPFTAGALAPYLEGRMTYQEVKADQAKYPLRFAVVQAMELMREKFNAQTAGVVMREYFSGTSNDRIKQEILKEQTRPAEILAELIEAKDELEKAGGQRKAEPSRRWQAHYDYALGEILARIVYLEEYNLALGKIRKDSLEPLANGQTGYRLASRPRLQGGREFINLAKQAQKLFEKVIKDHPGTPWEILARRQLQTALGLEWTQTRY